MSSQEKATPEAEGPDDRGRGLGTSTNSDLDSPRTRTPSEGPALSRAARPALADQAETGTRPDRDAPRAAIIEAGEPMTEYSLKDRGQSRLAEHQDAFRGSSIRTPSEGRCRAKSPTQWGDVEVTLTSTRSTVRRARAIAARRASGCLPRIQHQDAFRGSLQGQEPDTVGGC